MRYLLLLISLLAFSCADDTDFTQDDMYGNWLCTHSENEALVGETMEITLNYIEFVGGFIIGNWRLMDTGQIEIYRTIQQVFETTETRISSLKGNSMTVVHEDKVFVFERIE